MKVLKILFFFLSFSCCLKFVVQVKRCYVLFCSVFFFRFLSTTTSENWEEHHEAKQRTHALLMRIPFGLNGNEKIHSEATIGPSNSIHEAVAKVFICTFSLSLSLCISSCSRSLARLFSLCADGYKFWCVGVMVLVNEMPFFPASSFLFFLSVALLAIALSLLYLFVCMWLMVGTGHASFSLSFNRHNHFVSFGYQGNVDSQFSVDCIWCFGAMDLCYGILHRVGWLLQLLLLAWIMYLR